MRKIKFKLLTQQQIEVLVTDVRLFGEMINVILKSDLADKIKVGEVKFIERETKTEYGNINEAILPAGDCLFFVTPIKTKSGMNILDWDEITDMSYKELRTYGSQLNNENGACIILTGNRDDILDSFKMWHVTLSNDEMVEEDYTVILLQAIKLIEEAIILGKAENIEYAINGVTFEELEKEALLLKNLLNK